MHNARSRYQTRTNIIEEPIEDEDESGDGRAGHSGGESRNPYESEVGLDESRWEVSPTKNAEDSEVDNGPAGGGVLGLLYQFQKAQTDGRPGVSI